MRIGDRLFGSIQSELEQLKTQLELRPTSLDEFEQYKDVKVKQIVKVIDGDTIRVMLEDHTQVRIRLLMIDTPELRPGGQQLYAMNAMNFVKTKLRQGKEITIRRDEQMWDHYHRLLVYLYIDGELIQESLLKAGLARTCDLNGKNNEMVKRFILWESEAAQSRKKIWGINGYVLPSRGFNDEMKKKNRRGKRGKKKSSQTNW
ncbi:Endonuclease YncB, thermonuclease family [Seinonella peptonophila]|uniref:Endonuclease YncB, thermonuclease family n=1 Tax=Seinonella peptonophila TaxID=112248 RepID=A0A1M5BI23_9BACL|nr:thermonuclease family protein [Seinonella peptonophila]SHF41937.1 Endonuclease YncB, thermonuclease family [Seinonella peptonophila]